MRLPACHHPLDVICNEPKILDEFASEFYRRYPRFTIIIMVILPNFGNLAIYYR
ncbi:hypothetical protein SAMN05443574_11487 [Haloarcula vallismortis]|uniref:Uncharacterized protein n=1 Tax=Haloarcula vallismortis TaxID=28442 RepID=A0A1H2YYY5_HALVA|nr:hypothetical protein SAMN05443574_11487 [Haloarcula vallismortis]